MDKLLNEAIELINESAGKNGLIRKIKEEKNITNNDVAEVLLNDKLRDAKYNRAVRKYGKDAFHNEMASDNLHTIINRNGTKNAISKDIKKKSVRFKKPQNESAILAEAVSVLYEANGEKGLTNINNNKNPKAIQEHWQKRADEDWDSAKKDFAKLRKSDMQLLKKSNPKDFEFIGKDIRKDEKKLAKQVLHDKTASKDDKELAKYLTNTTPLKDKEEMRKRNIKLGYSILAARTEPSDRQKRLEKEDKINSRKARLNELKQRQEKFKKVVNESIDSLLIEAANLIDD